MCLTEKNIQKHEKKKNIFAGLFSYCLFPQFNNTQKDFACSDESVVFALLKLKLLAISSMNIYYRNTYNYKCFSHVLPKNDFMR